MADQPSADTALRDAYRMLMAQAGDGAEHPDQETTWDLLAHGELAPAARDALFDHVVTCEGCSRIWRGVLALQAGAQAQGLIAAGAPARATWLRSPSVHLALAASLVVAVGGLIFNRRPTPETPAAAPATSAAATAAPAATASGLAAFPLTKADIHVTDAEALAPRGAPVGSNEPSIDRLGAALEPYRRDAFAEAAETLGQLWREFPTAGRPALYLGVSLLHVNRDADAIAPLRAATLTAQTEVAADAHWYLAMALMRTGQTDAATTEVDRLCRAGGLDAARACSALKVLQRSRP